MSFLRIALVGEAFLALLALGLGSLLDLSLGQHLGTSWQAALWGIGATAPLMLGLGWILSRRRGPLWELTRMVVRHFGAAVAARSTAELAILAALAGVSEELLFRGVIQTGLARVMPAALALLVASISFGLAHFATVTYAVLAGIMGLYLGALLQLQGSLVAPMITHALYDFAALICVAQRYRMFPAASEPQP
jgi:uncharacterized protein